MKIAVHLDPHPAQATTQKAPAAIKELADIDPERAKAAGRHAGRSKDRAKAIRRRLEQWPDNEAGIPGGPFLCRLSADVTAPPMVM